ncbi:hypothetical protein Bbelb_371630 [Branchiostoma belcheri]|nr:hypothetical protein Bbelb_371630 [Branchiostoma belcheri]
MRELENEKFLMPGGKVIDEDVVDSCLQEYNDVVQECEAVFKEGRPSQPGDSAGDFLSREFRKQLASSNDIDAVRCTKMALFQHYLKMETCVTGCHDMREESLQYFGQYRELEGDPYNDLSGYNMILDLILKTIPPDCVSYSKKVQCIQWREEGKKGSESAHPVEVECEDGEVLTADHVIVTVPLGFLKKNCQTLFQPPLPEEKLASIERMGFGVVNKIFLTFQQPFWDTECEALHLVWDQDQSNTKAPEEWYKKTYAFYIDSKAPNTLLGWITGKEAEYMETLSEEEISNTFVSLLKKFMGKEDIPKPVRTMITRWGSDALTCGSYSYIHVGEKGDDINTVAEPLYRDNTEVPLVQFAGEATHSEFFSTVHGAYLTGQREANRLLNLYDWIGFRIALFSNPKHRACPPLFSKWSLPENMGHPEDKRSLSGSKVTLHRVNMASTGLSGSSRPQVVIVGGGMAGVAAAQRLVQEGLTHVKILEARDRIGGRIWTQYLGSDTLEFGANWIHGSIGNPIYELAKQHGLLRDEGKPADIDLDTQNMRELENEKFLMPGGKAIDEDVVVSCLKNYNEVVQECEAVFREGRPSQPGDSAGDFLSREFRKQLASSNDIDAVKCTKMALFQHYLKMETCITGCHDMREESLQYFGQYRELDGDHYNNPSGYNVILDLILKTIPPDCVSYNKKVQCIRWRDEGKKGSESAHPVEVECEDGEVLTADHVIVTVPLGFLKKNCQTLFQPPLPEEKLASIERMGFGVVNKIFLTFQQPFWDTECEALHLVWDQDQSNTKTPEEWYKKMYVFYIDSKAPNTLLGWISGKEAEYMETLSEEEISNTFVSILKKFMGKEDIPKPVRTMITRWGSDALTCGSYSYIHMGEKGDDINTVAEPLYRDNTEVPLVQFAGEATHSEFFSTVHGAYLTGQREANRLLNLYGSK